MDTTMHMISLIRSFDPLGTSEKISDEFLSWIETVGSGQISEFQENVEIQLLHLTWVGPYVILAKGIVGLDLRWKYDIKLFPVKKLAFNLLT